jgi:hypothetical protein
MAESSTVHDMPVGKDSVQVKATVKKTRAADYKEAAERANLPNLSVFAFQALEEKLQRDCPDLYKRR